MANNFDKKLGILYLKDYLEHETDENHHATVADIQKMLRSHDMTSDRRTIYSDLEILADKYEMDIVSEGYSRFVASRDFDLEEIKMLVDMVQSSNFLTAKKTQELIDKLKSQVSVHQAKNLSRRIYVRNRVKTTNESVYLNVDRISDAVNRDRKLNFQYFSYNISEEKVLRHDGKIHVISPFALVYVDQNYYMLGYDSEHEEMRHYRVDRMTNISVSDEEREGHTVFDSTDMSTYTNKVFYMFRGKEETVMLRCDNAVVDSIIDRFGEDAKIIKRNDNRFDVLCDVVVSPQFFAWLSPFGTQIEITEPEHVRNEFKDHLKNILTMYE